MKNSGIGQRAFKILCFATIEYTYVLYNSVCYNHLSHSTRFPCIRLTIVFCNNQVSSCCFVSYRFGTVLTRVDKKSRFLFFSTDFQKSKVFKYSKIFGKNSDGFKILEILWTTLQYSVPQGFHQSLLIV